MTALLAALLAAVPNAMIAILAPLVTEKFMASVLRRVIVFGLKKAAAMTETDVDDQIVADIERKFGEGG